MNAATVHTESLGVRAVSLLSGYRRLVATALPYSIPLPAALVDHVIGVAGRAGHARRRRGLDGVCPRARRG